MKQALNVTIIVVLLATGLFAWGQRPNDRPPPGGTRIRKPQMSDTVKASVYADNWFVLYINGELVAVDSITPHSPLRQPERVSSCDLA